MPLDNPYGTAYRLSNLSSKWSIITYKTTWTASTLALCESLRKHQVPLSQTPQKKRGDNEKKRELGPCHSQMSIF